MGGTHDVEHEDMPLSRGVIRVVAAILVPLFLLTIAGLIWLWPRGDTPSAPSGAYVAGEVTGAKACDTQAEPGCQSVVIRVAEGPSEGREVRTDISLGKSAPAIEVGTGVWLMETPGQPGQLSFADVRRDRPLMILAVLFAVAVVILSRWKGVAALAGLASSLIILGVFVLPALTQGGPPLAIAAVGASAIAMVSMGFAHGFHVRTAVALIGTVIALLLTAVLGSIFTAAAAFTGVGSEDAFFLNNQSITVDLRGLFLAGLVIGALGVLDDVTVTQASAVWEVRRANPSASWRQLFSAGMRVGKDHVAATVNTLVLAYVGASLPLFLLLTLSDASLGQSLNAEMLAQEVVRSLVGGLGIIAAVPITTALMSLVFRDSAIDLTSEPDGEYAGFWNR